ncbi:putative flavin-containing monooxygenase 1 [Rosellinia necatrix]|uniref:Putative flavin-containing monooxygenase 1 n=1 Tax=Rosellinia necatrix TaxID=77044 RepID=A0A1S7UIL5_ROSNE|nr:putative flavin-containing monooxygenase 1 [Rosellinia necatrix]
MRVVSLAFGYRALALVSVFLLWGIYALNGGLKANILAAWNGKLDADIPLKTDYTGLFVIDYPISLLVTFFYFATNGSDEGYSLMVFEGYGTLQSSFVWLWAEMMRPGSKHWAVATPLFFVTLSQLLGGAISLPFYYAYHILWADGAEILRVQDQAAARALPFSFLLGAIFPAILGSAPTWNGAESRSPEVHQKYLAFFQVDPLWVVLTQTLLAKLFRWLGTSNGGDPLPAPKAAHRWTRASYLLAATSSAASHVYAAARIYTSTDEGTNLMRMRVPYPLEGPTGGISNVLARGPFLYLQFDIPIFELASLVWTFWLLSRMPNRPQSSNLRLAFTMLIGYLTIGAGATVSLALYVREGLLPEKGRFAS